MDSNSCKTRTSVDSDTELSVDSDTELDAPERKHGHVLVIGATNRPNALDKALRRPGRFDREIHLGVPNEYARMQILTVLTRKLRLEGEVDLFEIARATPGFVGGDLDLLVNEAGKRPMKRILERRKAEILNRHEGKMTEWWREPWPPEETVKPTMGDFQEAAKRVQPSSTREGFSSKPNVKWEDVGGLHSLRKEFNRYIIQRIRNPALYKDLGLNLDVGFLLHGPPGCGKTLIAKAVATEAGANFIHIKGPEVLSKWVGESESRIRNIFQRARTCSPCIIFFDEVDALTSTRRQEDTGSGVGRRLLTQLLIELDGADKRPGVYVIGATNRLDTIDPALLRPGRLGNIVHVPLPNAHERELIMKTLAKKMPISSDVDLGAIAHREECDNLSGADLARVMDEAAMGFIDENLMSSHPITGACIKTTHIQTALEKIASSVSRKRGCSSQKLKKQP